MKGAVLALLLAGLASAQTAVPFSAVCARLQTARQPVLVYVPGLRSSALGDCLRKAVVDYRRRVTLLTVPYFGQDGAGLTGSLTLAGVWTYEANVNGSTSVLVIDGETFSGAGVGLDDGATISSLGLTVTPRFQRWFAGALQHAHRVSVLEVGQRVFGR